MGKIKNKGTDYYILSLKHTGRNDRFIILWRPNNEGYCWFKDHAGIYDGYEDGYHNHTPGNMPVRKVVADVAFSKVEYDGICKPSAISEDLGIEVKDVFNITKRLKRRLMKIQSKVKQYI